MPKPFEIANIDPSFDDDFDNLGCLTWYPWVGRVFSESRKKTLILGESVYDMPGKVWWTERLASKDGLRITHFEHAINTKASSRFVRNIERAIFQRNRPSATEIVNLWEGVAYYNLVQRQMATLKHRPSIEDYILGWEVSMEIFRILSIDQCIVYGLERNKLLALAQVLEKQDVIFERRRAPKVGRNAPKVVTFSIDGRQLKLLFVRHPSAFFSWRKWAKVLEDEGFTIIKSPDAVHNHCL